MNYHEAELMIETNSHLVDQTYKGKTIDKLIIVPARQKQIMKILSNLSLNLSSRKIYEQYSDFEIVAILDYEMWLWTGVLYKATLNEILETQTDKERT
ncbi:hypothetical protein [Pedobacter frigiditerrae]|uniref:hypothetical protein n=1 Tax=Pedobacter frigiditerrae TaxID=2530452 RepID=UPI00292EB172|nr:hypothetical protein [Pedobacter frigiditerrae]